MISPSLRVKIEEFRAISQADIIVDGITVVAGENGCGKSSISKLIYYLYKTMSNYEDLVTSRLHFDLRQIIRFLEITLQEIDRNLKDRKLRDEARKGVYDLRRGFLDGNFLEEELENWLYVIDRTEQLYGQAMPDNLSKPLTHGTNRLRFIVKDLLKGDINNDELSFSKIKDFVQSKFKEAKGKIDNRPTSLFTQRLGQAFLDSKLPEKFEVLEFDDLLFSLKKNNLAIPYTIQNAIYIDTPMMLGIEDSENEYWNDLNELLHKKGAVVDKYSSLISQEIIYGNALLDENSFGGDEFKFKRIDGKEFNLLDVATGIKSFSMIQLLLNNGSLNDKSLLIIDEPESNLHPQWIIEYARIIVALNKEYGIKFLLATHNPDMVSAIRYISEKEGVLKNTNFYLAEKVENKFSYSYKYLETDIDPIFESFNIAIERINQYGV